MKVLLITGMNSTKYGSLEKWIVLFGQQLIKNNYQLLVHYNSKPESASYLKLLVTNKIQLLFSKPPSGSFKQIMFFRNIIKMEKPDYVHSFFNSKAIYATALLRISKRRNFWTNPLEMPKHRLSHFITNRILNKICTIFPASEAIRTQMIQQGYSPTNLYTVYYGLPIELMDFSKPELTNKMLETLNDNLVICSIGHYREVKGMDLLLKSFQLIKEKFNKCILIQIGIDINDHPEFLKLAIEMGVEKNIVWLSIIDDAHKWINLCDVYVQPSRKEAMSFTVMEAAYMEKPVVAYNVGGIPEAIIHGQNGYLAEPEDYEDLFNHVSNLLINKGKMLEYGKNGKNHIISKLNSKTQIDYLVSKFYIN